jgi:hypothetical protein
MMLFTLAFALLNAGSSMPVKMAMVAIPSNSLIRVKPRYELFNDIFSIHLSGDGLLCLRNVIAPIRECFFAMNRVGNPDAFERRH